MDQAAMADECITDFDLMERAGESAFACLLGRWSDTPRLCVVAGAGNNGGDGYVLAALAAYHGLEVTFFTLGDHQQLSEASQKARDMALKAGVVPQKFQGEFDFDGDVIVDAILGTGLDTVVSGWYADAILAMNRHSADVLALDIPSGLNATTGQTMGTAIAAVMTVTFVAVKQGLLTCDGPDVCGEIAYAALGINDVVLRATSPSSERISWDRLERLGQNLPGRQGNSHKGQYGHVLVVGGDLGMAGAALMACEASCRVGAGLTSCATHQQNVPALCARLPELMSMGVESGLELGPLIGRATVLAVGPGLGQSAWSGLLFQQVMQSDLPVVLDADGLNWLSQPQWQDSLCHKSAGSDGERGVKRAVVLTPHPAEAARLLGCSTEDIQYDRFAAVTALAERYQSVVVLKGQGTLIARPESMLEAKPTIANVAVCTDGNPGMATGGMGDVLTGVIAALMAQGMSPWAAARFGVCLHSAAADLAVKNEGTRGLLATDVMNYLRKLNN